MFTRLLIDGYNLLFASHVFAPSTGPATLERTRTAFLQFLAGAIEIRLRARTTVVFDATHAPPGLPHEMTFSEMRVLFSRNPADADALIEALLEADRAPRELLVVSSDHRLQRAARQRGAKSIDSEQWFRDLAQQRRQGTDDQDYKPEAEAWRHSAELQAWLTAFADVDSSELVDDIPPPENSQVKQPSPDKPRRKPTKPKPTRKRRKPPTDEKPTGFWNPFPPGYGEDVSEDS